jgi:hypothetical protein
MGFGVKKNAVLLVGNDINNLSKGYSWNDLLNDLISFVGAKDKIRPLGEQFPLFYEEIWAFAGSRGKKTEAEVKEYIASKVSKMPQNELHSKIASLPVKDILTTNYEFTMEKGFSGDSSSVSNTGVIQEQRYSLFRKTSNGGKSFWHIHGDAQRPSSMALGYEHYAGYLQHMRNYVADGVSYENVSFDALTKRLKQSTDLEYSSWVDFFFTHDVHIVGLGLDFVEIHLWWLLTYRARASIRRIQTSNRITYYCPKQREDIDRTKLRLLKANNVDVQCFDRPNGDKNVYYGKVLRSLKKQLAD